MQEIKDCGRWVQLKSCQRYVQIWSSLAIQMKLPDHIAALLLKLRLDANVTTGAFVAFFCYIGRHTRGSVSFALL